MADCDWGYLSTLRTTREPRQPMPRLIDLLEYMARPGVEHVWVLLDIKVGRGLCAGPRCPRAVASPPRLRKYLHTY